MMKKIFGAVVFAYCMFALSACGGANENLKKQETKPIAATPLTYVSNNEEELYSSNLVETQEGVTISCTPNYILVAEAEGQFLFKLKDTADEAEDVKFTSNGLYRVDFYDFGNNLIVSEECNGAIEFGEYYYYKNQDRMTYINKVILYIKYRGNLYSAEFVREGA